ncbi:MAG: carboxypeptidase-like regulatory domain-containing protein, partial [Acidobacteriota bacterium]
APGWVSTPLSLNQDACNGSAPVDIDWVPATGLSGRLDIVNGSPPVRWPPLFDVRLVPCGTAPQRQHTSSWLLPADLQTDGRWTARVPTGCFDSFLQVPTFAPLPRRHLTFEPDVPMGLGTVSLSRGATLHVHSTLGGTEEPAAGSTVELHPGADSSDPAARDLPEKALAFCRVDARGWCDLVVDSDAPYSVLVHPSDSEHVPELLPAPPLEDGQGLVLAAELPASARLEVVLGVETRTLKFLTRLGARWAATPQDTAGWSDGQARHATFEARGTGSWESLSPGHWRLELQLSQDGLGYSVAAKDIYLGEGEARHLSWSLEVPRFEGVVQLRGEGVASRLQLIPTADTKTLTTSVVQVETGRDGRFEVLLPHAGTYRVVASPREDPARRSLLKRVEFLDSEKPVVLDLPEGRIFGQVLDVAGQPVADVLVTASALPAESRSIRSTATGQFELDALSSGIWMIAAQLSEGTFSRESSLRRVELSDDESLGPLDLVLEESRLVAVRVVDAAGNPIPKARVTTTPLHPSGGVMAGTGTFTTDPEGWFALTLPPGKGGSVDLQVEAMGFPWLSVRRALESPIVLEVSGRGGHARLYSWTRDPWTPSQLQGLVLISQTGALLHTSSVMAAPPSGPVLQLSNLAPGTWRLAHVEMSAQSLERLLHDVESLPPLAIFEVVPDETSDVWPQPPLPTESSTVQP